jgi:hypothetical protein
VHGVLFTPQYIGGVKSFMDFIRERFNEAEQILCPCTDCLNHKYLPQNDVERHLLLNGMSVHIQSRSTMERTVMFMF